MTNKTMMILAAINNSLANSVTLVRDAELEQWRETEILLDLQRVANEATNLARRAS